MSETAYIGRHRLGRFEDSSWKLQLVGQGEYPEIYADVEIPNDSTILALADEFLYGIAAAKDLTVKARRRNDE